MSCYNALPSHLSGPEFAQLAQQLPGILATHIDNNQHGDYARWLAALALLPDVTPSTVQLNSGRIQIGQHGDLDAEQHKSLQQALREFHPWRKGPFELFGLHIDTEWRSDWKWDRLRDAISPLDGRRVLDVGSSNAYYGLRMVGAGADMVLGIDPTLVYVMQYRALMHYLRDTPVWVLPLRLEQFAPTPHAFDTVFSMGVLYHLRDPIGHLNDMHARLQSGGELVIETLVVEGDEHTVLVPADRYARMRNVWFLPSVALLSRWLRRCGFEQVRVVDVSLTTLDEQRTTDWMRFESLSACLDENDTSLTVEGYPAPRRAVVVAQAR